jgi:hypothetical protein
MIGQILQAKKIPVIQRITGIFVLAETEAAV